MEPRLLTEVDPLISFRRVIFSHERCATNRSDLDSLRCGDGFELVGSAPKPWRRLRDVNSVRLDENLASRRSTANREIAHSACESLAAYWASTGHQGLTHRLQTAPRAQPSIANTYRRGLMPTESPQRSEGSETNAPPAVHPSQGSGPRA